MTRVGTLLIVAAFACMATAAARAAQGASSAVMANRRTSNDRVYTDTQADRGKVLFGDVCLVCHTDPFWKPSWQGRSLAELYSSIRRFMPDDNPGTLSGEEVVSALAYILRSNGVAAGTSALPDDLDALALVTIAAPPTSAQR